MWKFNMIVLSESYTAKHCFWLYQFIKDLKDYWSVALFEYIISVSIFSKLYKEIMPNQSWQNGCILL